MCVIFGQNASSPATKRSYLPGMRWASRSWFIPNPMLFQGAPMECARCLCPRSARGSLTMGLRPKVGLGRGNAKAVPRVPASWGYARAGPRLDSVRLQPPNLVATCVTTQMMELVRAGTIAARNDLRARAALDDLRPPHHI